jgi:cold shock CspA family protein
MKGKIHCLKPTYGFIKFKDGNGEFRQIFFHASNLLAEDSAVVGDVVTFDIIPSHKAQYKDAATHVRVIRDAHGTTGESVLASGIASDNGGEK